MSQTIKIKKSSQTGAVPPSLDWGELAINYADGKLYFKNSSGEIFHFTANGNAITSVAGLFDSIQLSGGTGDQAKFTYNSASQTVDLVMNSNVTQQLGEELYYPLVKNTTGGTIPNGTPVSIAGSDGTYFLVAKTDASSHLEQHLYLGVATEAIPNGSVGRITYFGLVRGINTSSYTVGDALYVDPATPGTITNTKPGVDKHTIYVGSVQTVAVDGTILVTHIHEQDANDVQYNNIDSGLTSTNVQGAIDELQASKADISLLSSNITLYPTTVASTISGYYRMVTSTEDADYNTTAVDVNTGTITTQNQLIASLTADAGLFIGNPGIISVPTIGNIKKTAGNSNTYAEFYFEIYKRTSSGTETLVGTSSTTGAVNPATLNSYYQFNATALFSNGSWVDTDRLVIKYYANDLANSASAYAFQFGGNNPVRTQLPVPVSVIPSASATDIVTNTSNFNTLLSTSDTSVQSALETLDDHKHDLDYLKLTGGVVTGDSEVTANLKVNSFQATQANIAASTSITNIDFSNYNNYYITLSTNTAFTVSGLGSRIGASGTLILKQDATGGRTFTTPVEMKTPIGGAAIAQYTGANSLSILSYYIVDSSTMLINYIGNFA